MMEAVWVRSANRMMTVASLLEDGIELSFADGSNGLVSYADVPELKERGAVSSLELPNTYEMVVWTDSGEQVKIPWDFARHYCDASYRPENEAVAMQGRQTLDARTGSSRRIPKVNVAVHQFALSQCERGNSSLTLATRR